MVQQQYYTATFFILIVIFTGCSSGREFISDGVVCTWFRTEETNESTNIYLLEFDDDGSFYLLLNETESDGSYYVRGNQLIISNESCEGQPGKYNFKITDAGALTISINEDFCSSRIQHLIGEWHKRK